MDYSNYENKIYETHTQKKISSCSSTQNTENFQGSEVILNDAIMDTCHYTFLKINECSTHSNKS